jgi:hypothetical protein
MYRRSLKFTEQLFGVSLGSNQRAGRVARTVPISEKKVSAQYHIFK